MRHEGEPAAVAGQPTQAGEAGARWAWVERAVWTERMLTALQEGVKGGVWFSLMDKVESPRGLQAAWERVRENAGSGGVDGESVQQFARRATDRLAGLSQALRGGAYRPLPVRRVCIPKTDGGRRPLGIPAVQDRIVQTALRNVLEPIFERQFCEHSYGFRCGRGAKDALRRVEGLLSNGHRYVVDADLKSYFDTIPHDRLMTLIRERVADGRLLLLIEAYLKQGVLEAMREWTPQQGTPQGAPVSPLLANIYLHPLDVRMRDGGYEMIRYADDFVVLCPTAEQARRALQEIRQWVAGAGLTLHAEKTRLVDLNEPGTYFEFLGYHFEPTGRRGGFRPGRRWPRASSLRKFKDAIRRQTRRTDGRSLEDIIRDVNATTKGWFEYFKHGVRGTFTSLDGWIRMRLRCLLRKRQGRRGRGYIADHLRWPNAYFVGRGLFSMATARAQLCAALRARRTTSQPP